MSTPIRLLIVDDEPHQREMLCRILDRAGYETRAAADGREALGALEEDSFDLVLTGILVVVGALDFFVLH